jgi:hypothetical protein
MSRAPAGLAALLAGLVALPCAPPANAHEHAPRVLSPHNADTYSLKTFGLFARWRDLAGDAKVYELFKYLADARTGLYPLGVPAWEGREELSEFGAVRDPIKMLNVYPIGHCGTLGPTMAGIIEGLGIGAARTLVLPGFHHVVAEARYGEKWHYLDLDLRAVFRRADGTLASLEEARRDAFLWKGPSGPLFFPLDSLAAVRDAYIQTAIEPRHGVASGGHTMDYILRRGETFTRWWKPQGGRWNHHPSYGVRPFPRDIIEAEPRGPKCKHASFTVHTHGNGRFVYRPDLAAGSADFADGARDRLNVRPGPSGLELETPGEGHATFEFRTPYVIVPLVGDLDHLEDDREASVVRVEGTGVRLATSLDNGLTWTDVDAEGDAADLTRHVAGTYGYLLRVALRGQGAVLKALEVTTWVQVHPASLPSLRKGTNHMRYVNGDHHGLPTHVLEIRDGEDRESLWKHLVEPPLDFDPQRKTRRIVGPFVVRVPAPPGCRIAWFSAGASFVTHQGDEAPATRNSMAYAADRPAEYRVLYEAKVPAGNAHWHYNADVEAQLDEPAKVLFLRYVGDPGVNRIRIYAHCLRETPCASSPVQITHGWREEGNLRTHSVRLEGAGIYDVVADGEPEDEFIEIAVPGGRG